MTPRPACVALGAIAPLLVACHGIDNGTGDATTFGATTVAAIDTIVEDHLQENHVAGVAVALIDGDRVQLAKGYGLASLELAVPVTPQTMFQSGSLGKMFTAAAVMVLVEDGKVELDARFETTCRTLPRSGRTSPCATS